MPPQVPFALAERPRPLILSACLVLPAGAAAARAAEEAGAGSGAAAEPWLLLCAVADQGICDKAAPGLVWQWGVAPGPGEAPLPQLPPVGAWASGPAESWDAGEHAAARGGAVTW